MLKFISVRLWVLVFSAASVVVSVGAQTLTRGPYLQMSSTSAMTVRWRTSTATNSVVRFGSSSTNLSQIVTDSASVTNHEVRLTGLSADTKYFYSVGSTATTLASGANNFFVTAPNSAKPTRVWVLGDSGNATSGQKAVRDAYYKFAGTRHTDLWLMLGDNAYMNGTDSQYQAELFNVYGAMLQKSALWPTFGNHDGESANSSTQTGPYFDMITMPKNGEAGGVASGTEAYYSFNYGNIHFVCLDSTESSRSTTGAMLSWLKRDLGANTKTWTIAFWHHPPYSKGSHNSDTETELVEMRKNALPILESYGVDLVMCGHSHVYERSFLINGHYGTSGTFKTSMKVDGGNGRVDGNGAYTKGSTSPTPYSGTAYIVAGTSAHTTSGGSLNHPAMYTSQLSLGSVVLDIDGDQLDAQFIDSTGKRRDYFTLRKGGGTANAAPTVAITSPTQNATYTASSDVTVNATASDSDGSVMRVDLYDGSNLLGTAMNPPYSFVWKQAPTGSHRLTCKATDDVGMTKTSTAVDVTVTSTPGGGGTTSNSVTSFTLINADTDQPVAGYTTLANGAVISRSALPTTHLNIRVNTTPSLVGSVKIAFDGKGIRTETAAPYALFADNSGNYNAGAIANGTHTITGTAYTLASGGGTASAPYSVSFTIK
jgi:hypothetical protein